MGYAFICAIFFLQIASELTFKEVSSDPIFWGSLFNKQSFGGTSLDLPPSNTYSTSRSSASHYSQATVTDGSGVTKGFRSGGAEEKASVQDPSGKYNSFYNQQEFMQPTRYIR